MEFASTTNDLLNNSLKKPFLFHKSQNQSKFKFIRITNSIFRSLQMRIYLIPTHTFDYH